ncbi:MAG: BCCT family transporter [Lachnospirales bacterium]
MDTKKKSEKKRKYEMRKAIKDKHKQHRKDLYEKNFTRFGLDLRLPTTLLTLTILIVYFSYTYIFRDVVFQQVADLKNLIVDNYRNIFIWTINASVLTLIIFLFPKKLGNLKIGGIHAEPEFSRSSWYAMLFSAGVGIGLLFYGVYEPLVHMSAPLYPNSEDTIRGITVAVFHWSLGGWGVYGICGLALSYYAFNKGLPLAPRSFLYPLIKEGIYGFAGDVFDAITIISSLFGLASSLGLGAMQINAGFKYLLGVEMNTTFQVCSIIFITFIATLSIVTGLKKGVKILSEVNVLFAVLLMMIIFFATPIGLTLSNIAKSMVTYVVDVIPTHAKLGSYDIEFLRNWSIFYWAWWCSWSIFVGMFVAKISKGRTVREFVIAVLAVPTIAVFLWFGVLGTAGQYIAELYPNSLGEMTASPEVTLYALNNYLFGNSAVRFLVNALCLFLVFSFFITSSDSGSLVVDGLASAGKLKAPVTQKIFWASMEGLLAIAILVVGGQQALYYLQNSLIILGLLLAILLFLTLVLFIYQIVRDLKHLH